MSRRVLYIVSTLKRCGPTNQLFGIVKNLDRAQFTPVVLTLSPEGADSRWDDFVALGVNVQTLGLSRLAGALKGAAVLGERITSIAPDLLHTQGIRADSLCVRLLNGRVPQVATLRNYPFKDYVMSFGPLQGRFMAYWHLYCLRQASVVALVSHAIHGMLGGRLAQARVVQNGVDVDHYHAVDSTGRALLRERLGLPHNARIFISTGHLDPRKDPLTALDGFIAGAREGDQLLVLGDGVMREELKRRYSQCAQIVFLGRVANVQEYLQASDYFISASLAEGLPNAVLEALACGLPCLLSDIAEHNEILMGSSLHSMLFATGESMDLAQCVKSLDKQNYSQAREAALAVISTGFSAAYMSNQYQALYRELLA